MMHDFDPPMQQCSWIGQRQNKTTMSQSYWGHAKPHDDMGQALSTELIILPSIPQPPARRTQFPIFTTPCPCHPLESATSLDVVQDQYYQRRH